MKTPFHILFRATIVAIIGVASVAANCPTGITTMDVAAASEMNLTGKTCLVTGGRSGLGYATSQALLSRGCKVVIASRNMPRNQVAVERLKETVNEIDGSPADVSYMTFDLESFDSVRAFAAEFREKHDRLDYYFANAAISYGGLEYQNGGNSDLTQLVESSVTPDGYDRVFQAVYVSQVLLLELLLPLLRESQPSRVILTSSSTHAEACGYLSENPNHDNLCFGDGTTTSLLPLKDGISPPYSCNGGIPQGYPVGKYLMAQMAIEVTRAEAEAGNEIYAFSWAPGNIQTDLNDYAVLTGGGSQGSVPEAPCFAELPPVTTDPEDLFYASPFHGAKAAVYAALVATPEQSGSFLATYWECEVGKGYKPQGITSDVTAELYALGKSWAMIDEASGGDSEGDVIEEDDIEGDSLEITAAAETPDASAAAVPAFLWMIPSIVFSLLSFLWM